VKKHFLALDGLRGTAALSVAVVHVNAYVTGSGGAPFHAFLAVDFFFILSGVVIAHAYEQRLHTSMTFLDFAKLRVVRLWPLIVAGLALGAGYLIARNYLQPTHAASLGYIMAALVFGFLLVPLNFAMGIAGYPLDPPCWSLFFEMVANAVYAVLCRFRLLSATTLFMIIGGSLLGLLADSNLELWDHRQNWPNQLGLAISLLEGVSRVGFGFFLGVALYRYRSHAFILRLPHLHPAIASALLVAFFAMPPLSSNIYDLVVGMVVLPLVVGASIHYESDGLEAALSKFTGWLSYPLYVVHYPIMFMTVGAWKYLDKEGRLPLIGVEAVTFTSCAIAAYLLGRFYDEPTRTWLASRMGSEPSGAFGRKERQKRRATGWFWGSRRRWPGVG
jgi:peptidoglycan/LPS O-acetylase OafA/YrhL